MSGVVVQHLDKIREFIDSFPVVKKYAAQVEETTKVNYGEEYFPGPFHPFLLSPSLPPVRLLIVSSQR